MEYTDSEVLRSLAVADHVAAAYAVESHVVHHGAVGRIRLETHAVRMKQRQKTSSCHSISVGAAGESTSRIALSVGDPYR